MNGFNGFIKKHTIKVNEGTSEEKVINFYTNDQRDFEIVKPFLNNFTKKIERIEREVFPFIKKINSFFDAEGNKQRNVLYTGQSLSDYLLTDARKYLLINDLDFFNMTFDIMSVNPVSDNGFFEVADSNQYNELSSNMISYKLIESIKFESNVPNPVSKKDDVFVAAEETLTRLINIVRYNDWYSEYEFKDLDLKTRLIYSSINTLNFFDLNNVQIGMLLNTEEINKKDKINEIDILYTKQFMDLIFSSELKFNPKRISPYTIKRFINKYRKLDMNLPIRTLIEKGSNLEEYNEADKYFKDSNHIKILALIFNRISKYILTSDDIKSPEGKITSKTFHRHELLYYIHERFESLFNFLDTMIINQNFDLTPVKRFTNKEYYENFLLQMIKSNVPIQRLTFDSIALTKEDKKNLESVVKTLEYLLTIFNEEYLLDVHTGKTLFLMTHSLANLSKLSLKKLQKLEKYCKKHSLNFKEILMYVSEEPTLLNRNLSDFRYFKYSEHSLEFFKLPLKNSLNMNLSLDYFISLMETIKSKIKEFNKDNKRTGFINELEIIGKLEHSSYEYYIKKIWIKIFNGDSIENIVDEIIKDIQEENKKLEKPFHSLKPISFKIDNIICEELTNSLELKREGEFMKHCVGGYGNACENFRSIIFRIRRKHPYQKDNFRYTFEISIRKYDDKLKFDLVQVQAKRNGPVLDDHKKIVYQIIDQVISILNEDNERNEFYLKNIINPEVNYFGQPLHDDWL